MVRYFEEGLKPSIKAEMDQDDSQLIDYEELVAKAVRAEAKAGLRPSSYVRETDLSCLRGNRPAHTTAHKVQTQGAGKDHCGNDSKASKGSASTPASASNQDSELSNKAKKDKKKNWRGKRDFREPKDSTTPASEVNAAEVGGGRQRRKNKKDISGVTQQEGTLREQVSGAAKKLVSVSVTSMSVTGAREEALERVLYIHYPVQFKKDKTQVQALVNSESEVNAMHPSFAKQLGLPI